MAPLIFIVDDDVNIRNIIEKYLIKEQFEAESFDNGQRLLERLKSKQPDLMVLDVMMPQMDGYELCREIRKITNTPIIFVSAKDDEFDKILGLELGADDYLSKPFSPRELVVRIKTVLRRMAPRPTESSPREYVCANTKILLAERKVVCGDGEIELTSKEFDLLCYLVKHKSQAFKREDLLKNVWGYDYIGSVRSIDDLVKRLRKQLSDGGSQIKISTVWGFGYKAEEE